MYHLKLVLLLTWASIAPESLKVRHLLHANLSSFTTQRGDRCCLLFGGRFSEIQNKVTFVDSILLTVILCVAAFNSGRKKRVHCTVALCY